MKKLKLIICFKLTWAGVFTNFLFGGRKMCGIAGVIYKDKKTHPVGDALTSMLESLQHRGPDSAGYAIYGSLNFPDNYYQLNIEVKRRRGVLDNLKSLLNQISPIYEEQLIESVGDSDVYKCKLNWMSILF